jgi:hypothetical protein
VRAFVSDPDARYSIRVTNHGEDVEAMVVAVANELRDLGAFEILEACAV